MLIRFSIENFSSFKERVSFSMIPGKGTLKQAHKSNAVKGISVLKAGVVFGANASGKSNLIKAIDFGKSLILRGTKSEMSIDYQYFKLDKSYLNKNSRIEYEIQHRGKNYAYGFVFNSEQIVEEWLYEISKKKEILVFERNSNKKSNFDLGSLLKKNTKEVQRQFLDFIAKGTPSNQLFLTEIRTRRVKDNVNDISDLLNVIDWFQNSLKVILPDEKYKEGIKSELKDDFKLQTIFEELLKYFDTGINGVYLEKIDLEKIEIPDKIINRIKEELFDQKSEIIRIILPYRNNTYFITKNRNELLVHKFMTKHDVVGQKEPLYFDTSDESDGTNRIIDFIPLMIDLFQGGNVFVVDEMERSLHPNLIMDIFKIFLDNCIGIDSQLIVASHESSLLTQKLLRKDEIWFIVKNEEGASKLHSLEEYNIRFDKEIRRDYLLGRFKAIPRIGNRANLSFVLEKKQ